MSPRPGGGVRTRHHEITLLPGMRRVIKAIRRDVEAAARRVLVETYIYHDEKFGTLFARRLVRARDRGALVRLLYDPLGSHLTDPAFFEGLRRAGLEVRAYRPPEVVASQGAAFPRDHSRIVLTDEAAYTGGAAWADSWLPRALGGEGWYDVCVRVAGPVVEDFGRLFERRWQEAAGAHLPGDFTTGDAYPDLELVGDTPDRSAIVLDRYCEAVRRAKTRVWIENAYFFPPEPLLRELQAACRRGVDVQVILPGETDLPILKRAARDEYAEWLSWGMRVFEYQPALLHSKLAVVDDDWCTVGSFNANPTSVAWANEVALFVFDPAFAAAVARQFEIDRSRSACVRESGREVRGGLFERAGDYLSARLLRLLDRRPEGR